MPMKYEIRKTSLFGKDVKRLKKQGADLTKLNSVVNRLANGERLEAKYRNHPLSGELSQYNECHIAPDWLLIYRYHDDELYLLLSRTGSHSDLF